MANVKNGNTLFVDSTGAVSSTKTLVHYVIVTATSANAVVVFSDATTLQKKADIRVVAAGETQRFDFSANPIHFPNGVHATTVTSAAVTLVVSYT
jgi:hypothetical protein